MISPINPQFDRKRVKKIDVHRYLYRGSTIIYDGY